ncbi:MAG: aldehyde dehydrogenase family protein, partial [Woeseiaceae bacterium]|nr:aldehyde dehydrogenase family protein [Woeseiaceae bacterium]
MAQHFSLMIPGAPEKAGIETVTAPYDGSVIADVETGDARHVEVALATAYGLYRDPDAWLPLTERIAILDRAAAIMTEQHAELALEAAREGGKPLPDSQVEVTRAIDGMRICVEVLRNEQGEVIPMGMAPSSAHRLAVTRKEPVGVVVAVSAFNHPLNLIVHQVAA